jgi:antirestriction protein ArdC
MEQAISSTRQDRVRTAHDQVDAALERLAEALRQGKPEDLVQYLRFWGSFHKYSYHNAMLILSQKPDATHVAGFQSWRKVGRFVRKGEHGIAILYPRIQAREDVETGETERGLSGFGVGYVFDVTATEGAPLPEPPAWRTEGPANPGDVERIAEEIRRQGITLRMGRAAVEERIREADGVTYRDGGVLVIAVRDDFDPAHTVHTLLHEFAHATLHFGADRPASREQRELEADAVALAVAAALGYDFTETSYRYLAGWDATAEGLAAVLPRVGRGVQSILRALGFADSEAPAAA